jgi:hypothetical protein
MTVPDDFTYAHYRFILASALDSGYRFAGFHDLPGLRAGSEPVCVLRHDCDNDLLAAVRLARIEADAGVRSTYFVMLRSAQYNLLAPSNRALVREMLSLGHRIGLHFDERAYAEPAPDRIPGLVDRERQWLSDELGGPIDAVSFHQPSAHVLENRIALHCLNTYDRRDMAGFHYVSDSNLNFREGCPGALFRSKAHPKIHLLLHPEWWTDATLSLRDKWHAMLADNFELMQQSLLEREATYREPSAILFRGPSRSS